MFQLDNPMTLVSFSFNVLLSVNKKTQSLIDPIFEFALKDRVDYSKLPEYCATRFGESKSENVALYDIQTSIQDVIIRITPYANQHSLCFVSFMASESLLKAITSYEFRNQKEWGHRLFEFASKSGIPESFNDFASAYKEILPEAAYCTDTQYIFSALCEELTPLVYLHDNGKYISLFEHALNFKNEIKSEFVKNDPFPPLNLRGEALSDLTDDDPLKAVVTAVAETLVNLDLPLVDSDKHVEGIPGTGKSFGALKAINV